MENLRIDFKPSEQDFNKLLNMLDDHKFYNGILQPHDRAKVQKSFARNGFIAHYYNEIPIGFTVWSGEDQWAEIEYKWILPAYRGKGLGKRFAELIYEEFVNRKIYYVVAQPATPCGDGMATHFGFRPLAETDYRFDTNLQYLFLKKNRPQVQLTNKGYELLIWHDSNDQADPAQIYKLDDTLQELPIVTIADTDAAVQIRKDGKIIVRNTCKHVFSDRECQGDGLFYFSTNLSDWLREHRLSEK